MPSSIYAAATFPLLGPDRGHERQGHDRADAGHGHQEAAYRVVAGQITDQLLDPGELAAQSRPRPQDRFGRGFQHRVAGDQLPHAGLPASLRDVAQLEPEVTQHTAQREFHVDERVLNGLARAQQRPLLLRRHRLAVHRPEPAHPQQSRDAFGIPAVRLDRHRLQRRLHLPRLHQHCLEFLGRSIMKTIGLEGRARTAPQGRVWTLRPVALMRPDPGLLSQIWMRSISSSKISSGSLL